jgi:hypothetical protein
MLAFFTMAGLVLLTFFVTWHDGALILFRTIALMGLSWGAGYTYRLLAKFVTEENDDKEEQPTATPASVG